MVFVPPETPAWNCCGVATVTDAVTGEIAMLMPVVGSVQEEEEALVAVVEVVVVQVTAVLGAVYLWHDARANTPTSNAKNGKRFTAPLSLTSRRPIRSRSIASSLP
jgi:hypothetical protein